MFHGTDCVEKEKTYMYSVFSLMLSDRKRDVRDAEDEIAVLKQQIAAGREREMILQNTVIHLGYDKNLRGQMSAMSAKFILEKSVLEKEILALKMRCTDETSTA